MLSTDLNPHSGLPPDLHAAAIAVDVWPQAIDRLSRAYCRRIGELLVERTELEERADVVREILPSVRWLPPELVWLARVTAVGEARPGLSNCDVDRIIGLLRTATGSPPRMAIHAQGRGDRWIQWGVRNLRLYGGEIGSVATISREYSNVDEQVVKAVSAAQERLFDVWREAAIEIRMLLHETVVIGDDDFGSASFQETFGGTFVGRNSVSNDLAAFETLLHECGHHSFFVRSAFVTWVNNPAQQTTHPLRSDPRPLLGTLHAAHVLSRIANGLLRWHMVDDRADVEGRLREVLSSLALTTQSLEENALWTVDGEEYFAEICSWADRISRAVDLKRRYSVTSVPQGGTF